MDIAWMANYSFFSHLSFKVKSGQVNMSINNGETLLPGDYQGAYWTSSNVQ